MTPDNTCGARNGDIGGQIYSTSLLDLQHMKASSVLFIYFIKYVRIIQYNNKLISLQKNKQVLHIF